ncbi:hypothetical protein JCM17960_17430 [Magnetospira thiophila]
MTTNGGSPNPLEDLDSRLRRAREKADGKSRDDAADGASSRGLMKGLGLAFRVATELVAAFAVGVGFGYLLDVWLDIAPFGLILGFFLGAAAGALNVFRVANNLGLAAGYSGPSEDGDDNGDDDEVDEMTDGSSRGG